MNTDLHGDSNFMQFKIEEKTLHFKQPAGTSRGVYTTRKSWFVHLMDGEREGVGECAPLPDLSCDARPDYGEVLEKVCAEFCQQLESQREQSSCDLFESLQHPWLQPYPLNHRISFRIYPWQHP